MEYGLVAKHETLGRRIQTQGKSIFTGYSQGPLQVLNKNTGHSARKAALVEQAWRRWPAATEEIVSTISTIERKA